MNKTKPIEEGALKAKEDEIGEMYVTSEKSWFHLTAVWDIQISQVLRFTWFSLAAEALMGRQDEVAFRKH